MKILLIGEDKRLNELTKKLINHECDRSDGDEEEDFKDYDLIIDANFDDDPSNFDIYAGLKNKPVILCTVKTQLAEISFHQPQKIRSTLIGANLLPTFIDRSRWEICLINKKDKFNMNAAMLNLGIEYDLVKDRVGMLTPRVVFMIINEACYTVQEGTATIADIDQAMKLGTNYPLGPFEWCDKIGVTDVFETLYSIYEDTKDERYKICPLLKSKYLKNEPFYS